MEKKLIFILFLFSFILVVPMVASAPNVVATIGQPFNITTVCQQVPCDNLTITVFYPNTSVFVDNQVMVIGDHYASYEITPPVFGNYDYLIVDNTGAEEVDTFDEFVATSTGVELNTSTSIVYSSMLFLLIFFFLVTLFTITQLPNSNTKDEDGKIMSISYLKYLRSTLWIVEYFLVVAIMFMVSNLGFAYLGETLFAEMFFNIYRIMFALAPVIVLVWMVYFFVKIYNDRQFQRLINRGMFPQGRKL